MPTVRVTGMTCQHCVQAVTRALSGMEGVRNVSVDLESGSATYEESRPVSLDDIRKAVEDAGYGLG